MAKTIRASESDKVKKLKAELKKEGPRAFIEKRSTAAFWDRLLSDLLGPQ